MAARFDEDPDGGGGARVTATSDFLAKTFRARLKSGDAAGWGFYRDLLKDVERVRERGIQKAVYREKVERDYHARNLVNASPETARTTEPRLFLHDARLASLRLERKAELSVTVEIRRKVTSHMARMSRMDALSPFTGTPPLEALWRNVTPGRLQEPHPLHTGPAATQQPQQVLCVLQPRTPDPPPPLPPPPPYPPHLLALCGPAFHRPWL